jgi:hypothetical protein
MSRYAENEISIDAPAKTVETDEEAPKNKYAENEVPMPTVSMEELQPENSTTNAVDNIGIAQGALLGAGVGASMPRLQNPDTRRFDTLQKRHNAQVQNVEDATTRLQENKTLHNQQIDNYFKEMQNAEAEKNKIFNQLQQARANLGQYTGETINKQHDPSGSGVRWTNAVASGLSPAGESSTESARLYNQNKNLPTDIRNQFNATNLTNQVGQGLLVPKTIDPNYKSPSQVSLLEQIQKLENEHQEAIEKYAQAKHKYDSSPNRPPKELVSAQNYHAQAERASERLANLLAEFAPEPIGAMKKFGYLAGRLPNSFGGALSGAQLVHALEQAQKGDTAGAIAGGVGGLGGLLMAVPHPIAKAVGVPMSLAPLAYEAYQNYNKPKEKP